MMSSQAPFKILRQLTCLLLVTQLMACRKSDSRTESPDTPAHAYRIIALAPNSVEVLFALGAGDRVVAVSDFAIGPSEALKLPKVGGLRDPDLETIISLKPDLVILRGKLPVLEQFCRERGIQTWHDPTDSLADIDVAIAQLGSFTDHDNEAAAMIRELRERLNRIRTNAAKLKSPRVLFTMRSPDAPVNITTVSKGSYIHELIELAGGQNVFGDLDMPYPSVSSEAILAKSPDVILETFYGQEVELTTEELKQQWSRIGPIPAVEKGRIVSLTDPHITIPSHHVADIAELLFSILHPEFQEDEMND